jgi:hypothetical protein
MVIATLQKQVSTDAANSGVIFGAISYSRRNRRWRRCGPEKSFPTKVGGPTDTLPATNRNKYSEVAILNLVDDFAIQGYSDLDRSVSWALQAI